jgi:hypothetical protein
MAAELHVDKLLPSQEPGLSLRLMLSLMSILMLDSVV